MNICIYDLEWSIYKKRRQIIQIGYLIYDYKKNLIIKKNSILIKPYLNNFINPRIEKLTGITNKLVQNKGKDLKKGINLFLSDVKNCKYNISNGNDYNVLKENYYFYKNNNNLLKSKFINCRFFLSKLAKRKYFEMNSCDLHKIFKFKISKCIMPHNALDDCYLILKSLQYNGFFKKKYYIQ